MRKKRAIYLLVIILIILSALEGCKKQGEDISIEELQIETPDKNEESINFTLITEDEKQVTLKDYEGKPVVMAFWVIWNDESKKQLKVMENVHKLLQDDVAFIAVHVGAFDRGQEAVKYFKEKEYSFDHLLDREGTVADSCYVEKFPTLYFLDSQGKKVSFYTGLIEEDQILDEIEGILRNSYPK